MGSLMKQMVGSGVVLADFTPEQQKLYEEQKALDIRYHLRALNKVLRYSIIDAIRGGAPAPEFLLNEYARFIRVIDGGGPLTESDFRSLLVWSGHGPAVIQEAWVAAFRKAVIQLTDY